MICEFRTRKLIATIGWKYIVNGMRDMEFGMTSYGIGEDL